MHVRTYLQFFSWSGDDFNVRDGSGSTVFIVKGNALSLRDRVVIADAQGNLIAMMQEKIVSLRKEFQVYSFKPNAEGQESTENVQGVPVYRFALIQKQLKAITTELCYKLYNGNDVGDTIMIAKAQMAVKLVSAWGPWIWKGGPVSPAFMLGERRYLLCCGRPIRVCVGASHHHAA